MAYKKFNNSAKSTEAPMSAADKAGWEAFEAVNNIDAEKLKELIDQGANLTLQDEEGATVLHNAVTMPGCLRVLVNSGKCNFMIKDNSGHTPLWYAMHSAGHFPSIRLIAKHYLKQCRDAGYPQDEHDSIYRLADWLNSWHMKFEDKASKPYPRSHVINHNHWMSPEQKRLFLFERPTHKVMAQQKKNTNVPFEFCSVATVNSLLTLSEGENPANVYGHRLIDAVKRKSLPEMDLLIRNGADVNVQDRNGQTPMHHATASGYWPSVHMLRATGQCNLLIQDYQDRYPHDLAIHWSHDGQMHHFLSKDYSKQVKTNTPYARGTQKFYELENAFRLGRIGPYSPFYPDGSRGPKPS